MSRTKCLCLISGAALSLSGVALAQNANLDQSRAAASELLADASGRTSQLAQPGGKFTVDVHGYMQFRVNFNQRDGDSAPGVNDETTWGFQTARTALNVSGNIISEDWYYFVQFEFERDGGLAFLQDAYGSYKFGNGWELMWGQFKLPFMREELVGDQFQLAAERSALNSVFSVERSQGIQLGFAGEQARAAFALSDGGTNSTLGFFGTGGGKNSDFTSGGEADFALTGRVDFKWAGDWNQAQDFTSFQQQPFFGMVGGAVHYQTGGETGGTTETDVLAATVDVSVEGNGWNAFGAFVYFDVDPSAGSDSQNMGFLAQGGIFVDPTWELFGRFDMIIPDDDLDVDDFSTLTLGVNKYFMQDSHAAKFTVNLVYFLEKQSESIVAPNTLLGLLPSDSDGQWNLQAQMQLVF